MQNGKVCSECGKPRAKSSFYVSSSSYDGLMPICRKCIYKAAFDLETNDIDLNGFSEILCKVNKPFIESVLETSKKEFRKKVQNGRCKDKAGIDYIEAIVGLYFKNISSLPQYKNITYSSLNSKAAKKQETKDLVYYLLDDNFVVTEDIIRLFGEGYIAAEYQQMQKTYNCAMQDYPNLTHAQIRLLLRYVRYDAKEHSAMLKNDSDVDRWSKLASSALTQFVNACSKTNADNSFSALMKKIKQTKNMKDVLPRFKYRPNDAPDFIIWCYINYCRRLEGKPEVPYEDVYKFYDEKVAEYVEQYGDPYGIFTDDPTKQNREKIKDFIALPPNYYGDEHGG